MDDASVEYERVRTKRERDAGRLTLRDPSRLPAAFRVCSQSAIFAAI